ncbi:hypothetical protein Ancab_001724 [Ancistrocladus abbreviatus]
MRLGGTLQDNVIYETIGQQHPCQQFVKNKTHFFGFNQACLSMFRWDELNNFFKETGAVATFGLNALTGRKIYAHGSAVGAWDSSNAESLVRYTASKAYNIIGWELGNELSGQGIGARITADQYVSDVDKLRNLIDVIYNGSEAKPLVLAPGGYFDAPWFTQFIDKTSRTKSVQVITHHVYNLGPAMDNHLVEKILDPSYLDGEAGIFSSLQRIIKKSGTSAVAWVGEAGGAYNGGHNLVTNAFVMNFWYLDQLGMAATYDTRTYCRQTLVGGNYGLLKTTTFIPNPDYYSALLWHRLMGKHVLLASPSGWQNLRAYAHCSKQSSGIVLLLLNLDGWSTVQVSISTESGLITSMTKGDSYGSKFGKSDFTGLAPRTNGTTREEYHLTSQNRQLHSQIVFLNGKVLKVSSSGEIPNLKPRNVNLLEPVIVDPVSVVFVHFPSIVLPACK